MAARGMVLGVIGALGLCGLASAGDPAPKELDVKDLRSKLFVLEDAQGGTFIVLRDEHNRIFYGPNNKAVYEQIQISTSSSGTDWSIGVWAPKSDGLSPASLDFKDGSYRIACTNVNPEPVPLKQVPADRAKQIIAKARFLSTGVVRRAHLLARDDAGVYYYVDGIAKDYGGHGERLFVGKKGAMKELPLLDTAIDSAGEVYSTRAGDMRLVFDRDEPGKDHASFIKGDKKTELRLLDRDLNARLIYRDLGVYQALGTPCEAY
jgi:hypothetical protein